MLQSPGVRPSSAFCGVQEIASQRRKIGHVRTKTTWTVSPLSVLEGVLVLNYLPTHRPRWRSPTGLRLRHRHACLELHLYIGILYSGLDD